MTTRDATNRQASGDFPEHLDLVSRDVTADRLEQLRRLFPEAVRDGRIDLDVLRRTVGDWEDNEPERERFGLTWPGKANAMRVVQQPTQATLVPDRDESVDFDESQNVVIEGDNLEVLKVLQNSYYGKVKLIYIDPPYNTGTDFIYPDRFAEGLQDYLRYTGQVSDEGHRQTSATETSGRFHSAWLNMMYPRLFLARNLLQDDGVILVSIDDSEINNLKSLMDDLFGSENFVAQFVWSGGRKNDSRYVSVSHEYILCYVRSLQHVSSQSVVWRQKKEGIEPILEEVDRLRRLHNDNFHLVQADLGKWYSSLGESHPSKDHRHFRAVDKRGVFFPADISWPGGGGPKYEVLHPKTMKPVKVPTRGWMFSSPARMQEVISEDRVHFGEDERTVPTIKSYLIDRQTQVPYSVIYQDNRGATKRLRQLMDGDYFSHPKDENIIRNLLEFTTDADSLVVDFFAGSGTTGHAVMKLNAEDGGNRRYILVQLPEPVDNGGPYKTISEITRERLRRAGAKVRADAEAAGKDVSALDTGFRAFRLDTSNFHQWQDPTSSPQFRDGQLRLGDVENQLKLLTDNVRVDRSPRAILTEIMLAAGFELTEPAEKIGVGRQACWSVAGGALLVCLERRIELETVRAMAELDPAQIVCLDNSFATNDQLRVNAAMTVRSYARQHDRTIAFRVV